jgi:mannose/fructose-specific phosphotransferase system component IIA
MDTTLGELVKDPQAKAVVDQYVPGVTTHPMYSMISGMSLNMILTFPQAAQFGITKEKLEALLAEVNKQVK